jgi:hypothetical protein
MRMPDMGWADLVVGVLGAVVGWLARLVQTLTRKD